MATKRSSGIKRVDVNKRCWFYPERKGLCVVMEAWEGGSFLATTYNTIPWKKVEAALRLAPR